MSLQPVGTFVPAVMGRVMPEGVEPMPRRPRYWAEGRYVVSSSRRRMSIDVAREALGHLTESAIRADDVLVEPDLLLVADMIRAIRDAERFTETPPPAANALRSAA
jgi:hypothetical protein